jgi:Beta-lactamase enzyme family
MKLTGNCLTAFFILLTTGCINSRETDRTVSNLSFVYHSKNNQQQDMPDTLLSKLLAQHPQLFNDIISRKDEMRIQVIYTQIDRGKKEKDKIKFTDHTFNLNADTYFYPASTVKLPVAILALQKLNELNIPGLDKNTMMITGENGDGQTEILNDPSAPDGRPTIAHYIKKILLVSDNDAFNRLYEFLGQEYINTSLHRMGYKDVQIIHRLDISLTEEQNRHTNPVTFIDTGGKVLYSKPAERSKLTYALRNTKLGNGYLKGGNLINEPFDFSKKNRLPLQYLHTIVRSILLPDYVSKEQQFNLSKEDYDFLRRYMSMMPQESKSPVYSSPDYWDTYVKFLLYGSEAGKAEPDIRIFNKVGDAYGFLIDAAYIVDYKNGIEFILSAVIYCNSDGIFNDDKYDYDKVGLPFMKNLGKIIYDYERTRVRKNKVLFSPISFNYNN